MLFGAFNLRVTETGLECDNWLPIVGNVSALDDVERLKDVLDSSLLRVFEGLGVSISRGRERQAIRPTRHDDAEGEGEADQEAMDLEDPTLSPAEVVDLDRLTSGVVKVLNMCVSSLIPSALRSRLMCLAHLQVRRRSRWRLVAQRFATRDARRWRHVQRRRGSLPLRRPGRPAPQLCVEPPRDQDRLAARLAVQLAPGQLVRPEWRLRLEQRRRGRWRRLAVAGLDERRVGRVRRLLEACPPRRLRPTSNIK